MQISGVLQCPVTISVAPYATERRPKAFASDPFSVANAAKSEMALMRCQCQPILDKALSLVRDNEALGQKLAGAQSREKEISRVSAQQMADKETQIMSLQSQMAKLVADKEAEAQRLQNMLKVTEQQKTADLATAQATWEQQKAQLNQQISSLQAQVNAVSGERDSLQAQAAWGARLAVMRASLEAHLISEINWCHRNPNRIWNNKPYDALAALQHIKGIMSNL